MDAHHRALAALAAAFALVISGGCTQRAPADYPKPPVAFAGKSDALKQTVVVPTLDTPMPAGKNVVWCGSFAAAWQRLGKDVLKEPIRLDGAQQVADRLNAVKDLESDLPPGSCYAAAGRVGDGIVGRIRSDMRSRFPSVPPPRFVAEDNPRALIAYAYLAARVKFSIPYFESHTPLGFHASSGTMASVGAFGLPKENSSAYQVLRKQAAILLADPARDLRALRVFAIDLCRTSDIQVVVAALPRGGSLAATLKALDKEIAETGAFQGDRLGSNDTLLVPNMNWRIDHHFKELEGRGVLNAGMPIVQAEQETAFRLDRSGAELSSEAKLAAAAIPMNYVFDRPYLLYLKNRGAKAPFFAMWVDNAELLSPPAH